MSFFIFKTKSLPEYKIPELKVDKDLLDITKLKVDVSEAGSPIPLLKSALKASNDVLNYRYKEAVSYTHLTLPTTPYV